MNELSTPKKVAATVLFVSSIVGATAYVAIATNELSRMYGHPMRKVISAFKAKKIAKGFNPDTASW